MRKPKALIAGEHKIFEVVFRSEGYRNDLLNVVFTLPEFFETIRAGPLLTFEQSCNCFAEVLGPLRTEIMSRYVYKLGFRGYYRRNVSQVACTSGTFSCRECRKLDVAAMRTIIHDQCLTPAFQHPAYPQNTARN